MLFNKPRSNIQSNHSLLQNGGFLFVLIFLIIFRIWIIAGVPKQFIIGPHDDLFYAKGANYLLNNQWLGPYDSLTLIKVPFYTMFLTFSASTGLPLFLNENLLYLFSCLILHIAISPLIRNRWWRLLVFTLLLYCPASIITNWNLRVYREFVYLSITLFVIAFAIGLLLRINAKPIIVILWTISLGISLGAFILTREEAAWIYPMLFLFTLSILWLIWKGEGTLKVQRSAMLLIPIILAYIPVFIVSELNYSHYGFWGISDQLDPDFNRVLNTLGRIKTSTTWYPYVRVSRDALQKAYAASPMMAQLKSKLDPLMDAWEPNSEEAFKAKPIWYQQSYSNHMTEIGAGHFPWVLRDAVSETGYFNGKYPKDYFRELANELENACDTGKLECSPSQSIPFIGTLDERHLPILGQMFFYQARLFMKLSIIGIPSLNLSSWQQYSDNNDVYVLFKNVAHNPINTISDVNSNSKNDNIWLGKLPLKLSIVRWLYKIYRFFTPILTIVSSICFIILVIATVFKKTHLQKQYLIILFFLVGLLFTRFTTLVIVDTTTTAAGVSYGASMYLFLYTFITISIYAGITQLRSFLCRDEPKVLNEL